MIKAYIKHIEMEKHGMKTDDPVYEWCRDNGIVRVEVELKKRMLHDEGMHKLVLSFIKTYTYLTV
jgi:hypothetical protein